MSNGQESKSLIAADVEIIGTIKSSSGVRIEGKLDGELICSADASIGKSAAIKGNLSVNSIVVEGLVQGNITAKDKIEMKSTAKVHGDIVAKRLSVEDGVTFIGRSEVNPSGSGIAAPKPEASAAAAPDAKPENPAGGIFGRR
ncbi:MAG TPA: polymer-forming cytoskeletal protein [Kiritimatiellia bacterium]|nr:polymer-forming cytoskeletal protein [Kiritimatiellia bacterium]HMO97836.1 polymer-forming cytoskeletal protein [Kiritimatiellia bacterium]